MSDIVVFCGPTISPASAGKHLAADYRPPAASGDVYRAAADGPSAIAVIDGLFHDCASVWHKEILWAMHQGVHVFGAASMGALRAAELAPFGMVGVGAIYEHFANGDVTDDDDVAVAHLDADHDWRPMSEAFANLRSTIDRAAAIGVVSVSGAQTLIVLAKERHYAERSLGALVSDAAGLLPAHELARFVGHVGVEGVLDQKRIDAVALLEHVAAFRDARPGAKVLDAPFENTSYWEAFRSRLDAERSSG